MKLTKAKHPKMVESKLQARLMDQEEDLMAMKPASPKEQSPTIYDEEDAKKKGPSVPALNMKMMAKGGKVEDEPGFTPQSRPDMGYGAIIVKKARGGMIEEPDYVEDEDDTGSIASAIMRRRRMAEGGQVDIELNAQEEQPNDMDDRNMAALKENYDEDLMDVTQPIDSNEHSDRQEMIKAIRSKMISKRISGMK